MDTTKVTSQKVDSSSQKSDTSPLKVVEPDSPPMKVDNGLIIYPAKSNIEIKLPKNIYSTFIKNMKSVLPLPHFKFIQSLLTLYGDRICIAGGFCTNMLLGLEKFDDIDFFFHTMTSTQFRDSELSKILELVDVFNKKYNNKVLHYISDHAVTVFLGNIKLQFITSSFSSIQSILESFDLGPCCIAYNGDHVFVSDKAKRTFENGYYTFNLDNCSITYERRLVKYFKQKGFGIYLPNFDMTKLVLNKKICLPKLTIEIFKKSGNKYHGNISMPDNFKMIKWTIPVIDVHNVNVAKAIANPSLSKSGDILIDQYTPYEPKSGDILIDQYAPYKQAQCNKSSYILMNKSASSLCKYGFKNSSCEQISLQSVKINWTYDKRKPMSVGHLKPETELHRSTAHDLNRKSDKMKTRAIKAWYGKFVGNIDMKHKAETGWSTYKEGSEISTHFNK